jgi:hypothetical protein
MSFLQYSCRLSGSTRKPSAQNCSLRDFLCRAKEDSLLRADVRDGQGTETVDLKLSGELPAITTGSAGKTLSL